MKHFIILFSILIFSFINLSCQKKKEEKIEGSWQYVYLTKVNKVQTWTFNNDYKLIRSIKTDTTTISDTANWSMDVKYISKSNLKISNFNDIEGTYEIQTLNRKYLVIQRILFLNGSKNGAFIRMEFVKLH
ncbi:MAG: hypothetical protein COX07_09725 [Bacteroidetes bacterium CG23_combo_of_CG06-09_8_20_14_all_32_9]|nr:MAG: hypothetical protein COX07_09725 [Bacteroidetes bacterium CG23_combo_of_CG06-09_8_20_14_all_32_9]